MCVFASKDICCPMHTYTKRKKTIIIQRKQPTPATTTYTSANQAKKHKTPKCSYTHKTTEIRVCIKISWLCGLLQNPYNSSKKIK